MFCTLWEVGCSSSLCVHWCSLHNGTRAMVHPRGRCTLCCHSAAIDSRTHEIHMPQRRAWHDDKLQSEAQWEMSIDESIPSIFQPWKTIAGKFQHHPFFNVNVSESHIVLFVSTTSQIQTRFFRRLGFLHALPSLCRGFVFPGVTQAFAASQLERVWFAPRCSCRCFNLAIVLW